MTITHLFSPHITTYGPRQLIINHRPRIVKRYGRRYYRLGVVLPHNQSARIRGYITRPSGLALPIDATGLPCRETIGYFLYWPADPPEDPPPPPPTQPKPNTHLDKYQVTGPLGIVITGQAAKDLIDSFHDAFPGLSDIFDPP